MKNLSLDGDHFNGDIKREKKKAEENAGISCFRWIKICLIV